MRRSLAFMAVVALQTGACAGAKREPPNPPNAAQPQPADIRGATSIRQVEGKTCMIDHDAPKLRDGQCSCALEREHCGGAPTKPRLGGSGVWRCTPSNRNARRPDGCPFYPPSTGSPCTARDKTCTYGHCGRIHTRASCSGSTWNVRFTPQPDPVSSPHR